MKIIVTGGTGFVGGKLTARLMEKGYAVMVITRDKGRAAGLLSDKAGILEADISKKDGLKGLRADNIGTIIHCAASLSYFGDKVQLYEANIAGTMRLLGFAAANGIRRFIYISSTEAMGACSRKDIPMDESRPPAPLSSYGRSKLAAEKVVLDFAAANGIKAAVLRLGNVYGPPSPAFIKPIAEAVSAAGPLLRYLPGYGGSYMHPVFIDDAVEGIIRAVDAARDGQTYILAGKKYVTAAELFKSVAGNMGASLNIDGMRAGFLDMLALRFYDGLCRMRKRADLLAWFTAGSGGRIHRAYSIEKAARELGYAPQVSLEDGVHRTMEWLKKEGRPPK